MIERAKKPAKSAVSKVLSTMLCFIGGHAYAPDPGVPVSGYVRYVCTDCGKNKWYLLY